MEHAQKVLPNEKSEEDLILIDTTEFRLELEPPRRILAVKLKSQADKVQVRFLPTSGEWTPFESKHRP